MNNLDCILEFLEPHRPWLILPDAIDDLVAKAERVLEHKTRIFVRSRSGAIVAASGGKNFPRKGETWDSAIDMPGMSIVNGVADIPIYGPIGDKLDPLAKWYYDATDLRDVNRELDIAAADPSVKGYLFTMDTPGGSARGIPETADRISAIAKPKMTFVDGMSASAGYWLAASTDQIFTTRGGDVGSIGVYSTFYDMSKRAEMNGVKVQVFSSGRYKGAGVPGTSLTNDHADYIKADVLALAEEFKAHVRAGRARDISSDVMQGQMFGAQDALKNGLLDGIVKNKTEVLRLF